MSIDIAHVNGFLKKDIPFSIGCAGLNVVITYFYLATSGEESNFIISHYFIFIPPVRVALEYGGSEAAAITGVAWACFLVEFFTWSLARFRGFNFKRVRINFVCLPLIAFSFFNFSFYGNVLGDFLPMGRAHHSVYEDAVGPGIDAVFGSSLIVFMTMTSLFYVITFMFNAYGVRK